MRNEMPCLSWRRARPLNHTQMERSCATAVRTAKVGRTRHAKIVLVQDGLAAQMPAPSTPRMARPS